ncbi:hypothetical protein JAAARDRAFT_37953 [Jaapia argillacea MUCL 33604]|uniref:DUF6533 domain-containing protein n=1 Tax=Jaapia argillacea MUCL 33604 TaxID=933084 RepID=A0A067PLX6_9AGAM|nr:hypothetical protein JAAARDRAFT_37953 [Jaapia argillacea MUCL 33604]
MATLDAEMRGVLACNYSAVAAFAFTLWDICVTIDDEVKVIWTHPWTFFKMIFAFMRVGSIVSQVVAQSLYFKLSAVNAVDSAFCYKLLLFQGAAGCILMFCCQSVLISRASALYSETPRVRIFLLVFYFAEIVIVSTVLIFGTSTIQYGPFCQPFNYPRSTIAFGAPPVMLDTILFGLTMRKFYQYIREGWGSRPIISKFMTDGIWAFVLAFVVVVVNTVFLTFVGGILSSVVYPWYLAIPSFIGYRLILNIIYLFNPPQLTINDAFDITSNSIHLDTFAIVGTSPSTDPACESVGVQGSSSFQMTSQSGHDRCS